LLEGRPSAKPEPALEIFQIVGISATKMKNENSTHGYMRRYGMQGSMVKAHEVAREERKNQEGRFTETPRQFSGVDQSIFGMIISISIMFTRIEWPQDSNCFPEFKLELSEKKMEMESDRLRVRAEVTGTRYVIFAIES
jgi:hypothetical protein